PYLTTPISVATQMLVQQRFQRTRVEPTMIQQRGTEDRFEATDTQILSQPLSHRDVEPHLWPVHELLRIESLHRLSANDLRLTATPLHLVWDPGTKLYELMIKQGRSDLKRVGH